MNAAVLGAGKQGLAVAYDLARHGGATSLTLMEANPAVLREGARRLRRLLPGTPIRAVAAALSGKEAVRLLRGHAVAVSALPYRFNPAMARAAVEARVHFVDLGGNTDLVLEELDLDRAAKRAGVGVVPDAGLAPASPTNWPPSPWKRSRARGGSSSVAAACRSIPAGRSATRSCSRSQD